MISTDLQKIAYQSQQKNINKSVSIRVLLDKNKDTASIITL